MSDENSTPVMTVTEGMVLAGSTMMVAAMEDGMEMESMVAGVFMAMMAEHEGGNIAFTGEGEEEIFRLMMGKAH